MTALRRRATFAKLTAMNSSPLFADHPGEKLDARMFEMEPYLLAIGAMQGRKIEVQDAEGNSVHLSEFVDKDFILYFIYANCPNVYLLRSEKFAAIQESIDDWPMSVLVQFISITTYPVNHTPDVLCDYKGQHRLDTSNWFILTKRPDHGNNATRFLARDNGLEFTITTDSTKMKRAAFNHALDVGGRLAEKFRGMDFENVKSILYVSELIDNAQHRHWVPSWRDQLTGMFQ